VYIPYKGNFFKQSAFLLFQISRKKETRGKDNMAIFAFLIKESPSNYTFLELKKKFEHLTR
jgi:hypothetical protein